MSTQETPAKNPIQVIERMMTLLNVLAEHPDPVPLKQLAIETGLHPSTAHRILGAMTSSGFVERNETGIYRLGIRLLELGSLVKSRISLRETAMSAMLKLHATTGESGEPRHPRRRTRSYMWNAHSSGRSAVRVVHIVGAPRPAAHHRHRQAVPGRGWPPEGQGLRQRTGLPSSTPTSITTLQGLEKELDKVRRHGVAYDWTKLKTACAASPPASATTAASWWPDCPCPPRRSASTPTGRP